MDINKKAIVQEIINHGEKYGVPTKRKSIPSNDFQEEALDLNLGKPAKQFDIVEVMEGPYQNECKVGERFVALEVLSGDYTVISMNSEGNWISLCFPEEYVVVSNVEEFTRGWKEVPIRIGEESEIKYLVKPKEDMP